MKYVVLALTTFLPLPAMANCIPPWQTQFACNIPDRDARVEFCRIADPKAHPDKKEAYYNYVTGTKPSELYFETNSTWFSTKDTNVEHPTDMTMALGYARGEYVYAFVVTEDKRLGGAIRDAEVRVYSSTEKFTNDAKDNESARLYCDSKSIIADQDSIAP